MCLDDIHLFPFIGNRCFFMSVISDLHKLKTICTFVWFEIRFSFINLNLSI